MQQTQVLDDYDVKLMSPAKRSHLRVMGKMFNLLFISLEKRGCRVYADGRPVLIPKDILEKYKKLYGEKFKDQFPRKYFIPDLVVVCDKEIDKEDFIEGAPTLVVEILSAKTYKIDTGYKKEMYKEMGVKEYWLIEPASKWVEIFNFLDDSSKFYPVDIDEPDINCSSDCFPDFKIYLNELFEDV